MASARANIVKLEDVELSSLHGSKAQFRDNSFISDGRGSTSIIGSEKSNKSRPKTGESGMSIRTVDSGDSGIEGEEEEAQDSVSHLPHNWPKIPQLFRWRSCEFTHAVSTCVNKANSHLELLQTIIEEWMREREREMISRASSGRTLGTGFTAVSDLKGGSSRKQLRFRDGDTLSTTSERLQSTSSVSSHSSSATPSGLSIVGMGANARQSEPPEVIQEEPMYYQIPYLGAEEVVSEVIVLIARLENDRMETEKKLNSERAKVEMLQTKIDNLAKKRLVELPRKVQHEHEACAQDINELRWHCSYKGRHETRIKNKMGVAEMLNKQLSEDIAFVNSHCPLVEEKLDLEREAMDKINFAQNETAEELEVTLMRCAKVQLKSDEAHVKAVAERKHMKVDLDAVRKDLNEISEDLAETKRTYNSYVHQVNDGRTTLVNNEQEVIVLEVKCENAKASEAMQAKKVKELQTRIVEAEFEHRRLENDNFTLESERDIQKSTGDEIVTELQNAKYQKEERLKVLRRDNQERDMEVEDLVEKLNECAKQKTADEKSMSRINKELVKTDEQMQMTLDNFAQIATINNAVQEELKSEEARTLHVEESLKAAADALRKQVKEEMHNRTIIQARINSDGQDMVKSRAENLIKKEKIEKKCLEITTAVKKISKEVESLRKDAKEKDEKKKGLTTDVKTLKDKHADVEGRLTSKKDDLEPKHKSLTAMVLNLTKKIDHIEWRTEMMENKMTEMDDSEVMMVRAVSKAEKAIKELTMELEELTIQLDAGSYLTDDLKSSLDQIKSRVSMLDKKHKEHMRLRQEVKQQHDEDLENRLTKNDNLASKYRQLQNEHNLMKNKLLDRYDERVTMELAIKDLKQLNMLQRRMHSAMAEYYKYRGEYNRQELHRMEGESNDNGAKVSLLQDQMDVALEKISSFIKNEMDGSAARRMADEKLQREADGRITVMSYINRANTSLTDILAT